MELRVTMGQLPSAPKINFEELKTEISASVKKYETLVYTNEQMKDAKADKAKLNKLKKALNDARIEKQKEYMTPFNAFKAQIDELIGIIDGGVSAIDKQVKEYDEGKKAEKRQQIEELFVSIGFQPFVKLEQIWSEKWLNVTYSLKQIEEEMREKMYSISTNLLTLSNLPLHGFEAIETYKSTLDIKEALNKANKLAEYDRKKQEVEKAKEEIPTQAEATPPQPTQTEKKQWVSFTAELTAAQAKSLKEFFERNKINFKKI